MKKLLSILIALILAFILVTAIAETADEPVAGISKTVETAVVTDVAENQPFSWTYLATIAGATAATLIIVQFLKFPLDKIWKIPTRIVVYVIALAITLVATHFTTGLTVENGIMGAFNAFMVAIGAYGAYEITFAKLEK